MKSTAYALSWFLSLNVRSTRLMLPCEESFPKLVSCPTAPHRPFITASYRQTRATSSSRRAVINTLTQRMKSGRCDTKGAWGCGAAGTHCCWAWNHYNPGNAVWKQLRHTNTLRPICAQSPRPSPTEEMLHTLTLSPAGRWQGLPQAHLSTWGQRSWYKNMPHL